MQRIPSKKTDASVLHASSKRIPNSYKTQPELDFTLILASQLISLSNVNLSKAMRFTDQVLFSPSFPHHPCQVQLLMYHHERNNLRTAPTKLLDLITNKKKTTQEGKKSSVIVNLNDQLPTYPSVNERFLPNLPTTVTSASRKAQNKKRLQTKTKMPALNLSKTDSRRL